MRSGTGNPNYLIADHLGSTSLTLSTSGSVVAELRYAPFGKTRTTSGITPTIFHFTGQREDPGLGGLMFYRARYYDNTLGRFAQADTLIPGAGNALAWDRYAYGLNNPSRYTDPTGHFSQDEIMSFFNKEKWEDVEKLFQEGGELEGRWGWLSVLQKAEVGDEITINWDQSLLPEGHLPIGENFSGKFEIDRYGHLQIIGKENFMDQMKAAKYGLEYELGHYEDNNGKKFAAAFLAIVTDVFIGLPLAAAMGYGAITANPIIYKPAEWIETYVVLPVNLLAVKMWVDAENEYTLFNIPANIEQNKISNYGLWSKK